MVDAPLDRAVNGPDFHHFQSEIAELMRGKKCPVRPAERNPRDILLRLQLREKNELALVRLAGLEDVLNEQRADCGMRRARFGDDGSEFLCDRRHDLPVDGVRQRAAVGFRRPPPKHVDADRAHHDRCEDETGNRQANARSHNGRNPLLSYRNDPHDVS